MRPQYMPAVLFVSVFLALHAVAAEEECAERTTEARPLPQIELPKLVENANQAAALRRIEERLRKEGEIPSAFMIDQFNKAGVTEIFHSVVPRLGFMGMRTGDQHRFTVRLPKFRWIVFEARKVRGDTFMVWLSDTTFPETVGPEGVRGYLAMDLELENINWMLTQVELEASLVPGYSGVASVIAGNHWEGAGYLLVDAAMAGTSFVGKVGFASRTLLSGVAAYKFGKASARLALSINEHGKLRGIDAFTFFVETAEAALIFASTRAEPSVHLDVSYFNRKATIKQVEERLQKYKNHTLVALNEELEFAARARYVEPGAPVAIAAPMVEMCEVCNVVMGRKLTSIESYRYIEARGVINNLIDDGKRMSATAQHLTGQGADNVSAELARAVEALDVVVVTTRVDRIDSYVRDLYRTFQGEPGPRTLVDFANFLIEKIPIHWENVVLQRHRFHYNTRAHLVEIPRVDILDSTVSSLPAEWHAQIKSLLTLEYALQVNRVVVEELGHAAGYYTRLTEREAILISSRMCKFEGWLSSPAGRAYVEGLQIRHRTRKMQDIREADIMSLLIDRAWAFTPSEEARYPIRGVFRHWLSLGEPG